MKTNKIPTLLAICYISFFLFACSSSKKQDDMLNPPIENAGLGIEGKGTAITKDANYIESKSTQSDVKEKAKDIKEVAATLKADDQRVKELQLENANLKSEFERESKKIKLEMEREKQDMYMFWTKVGAFVSFIGAVLLVLSIRFAFLCEVGFGGALLGILTVGASQFMSTNDTIVIIICGVCVVAVTIFGVWKMVNKHKSVMQKEVAITETAKAFELMKKKVEELQPGAWSNDMADTVYKLYSPSTQDIINHVKHTQINNR